MPRARAASSASALAYPASCACSPGARSRWSSESWIGPVISTSVTGAAVVSVLVIRSGTWRRPSRSGPSQVSEMCTLYPVQPLPRFSAYRASRSYGDRIRVLPGGRPCSSPRQITFSPSSRQNCWIQTRRSACTAGRLASQPGAPGRQSPGSVDTSR